MDSLLLCSYKSVKQLNHISMLWLVQLRFDTEEDMSFCRCMKCGEEGQDVFRRERVSNHWSVTLQESSNWKWNGPYFDDQSFVETSYPSSMYRPCTAQSSRTKTLDGCLSFISVSVRIHVQPNQKIFPSLWKEPMTRFAITKLKRFLKMLFLKGHQSKNQTFKPMHCRKICSFTLKLIFTYIYYKTMLVLRCSKITDWIGRSVSRKPGMLSPSEVFCSTPS